MLNQLWVYKSVKFKAQSIFLICYSQERYNDAHTTRSLIKHTNGLLKSTFRFLDKSSGGLKVKPTKACKVIIACCVLHNICMAVNEPDVVMVLEEEIDNYNAVDGECD